MAPPRRLVLSAVAALGVGCSTGPRPAGQPPRDGASTPRPSGAVDGAPWAERVARLAQLRLPLGASVERATLDCDRILWARVAVDAPALLALEAQLGLLQRDAGPFYFNDRNPVWWGVWPPRMSTSRVDRLPLGGARLVWIDHTPGGFAGDSPGAAAVLYVRASGLPPDVIGEAQVACAPVGRRAR